MLLCIPRWPLTIKREYDGLPTWEKYANALTEKEILMSKLEWIRARVFFFVFVRDSFWSMTSNCSGSSHNHRSRLFQCKNSPGILIFLNGWNFLFWSSGPLWLNSVPFLGTNVLFKVIRASIFLVPLREKGEETCCQWTDDYRSRSRRNVW